MIKWPPIPTVALWNQRHSGALALGDLVRGTPLISPLSANTGRGVRQMQFRRRRKVSSPRVTFLFARTTALLSKTPVAIGGSRPTAASNFVRKFRSPSRGRAVTSQWKRGGGGLRPPTSFYHFCFIDDIWTDQNNFDFSNE